MLENDAQNSDGTKAPGEHPVAYHVLRYTPNLVRDEWVNIGILLFDRDTGERRLRLIEDEEEYRRVRRIHPQVDENALRLLRDNLEDRFQSASSSAANGGIASGPAAWLQLLAKWDETLSQALQLASQKALYTTDLDAEMERLYADHVAVPYVSSRVGAPGTRARVRAYCSQVFRQARLWERIEKAVRAEQWTLPGDPMRIDYSYRRNDTRGFVHTLSVTRAPGELKQLDDFVAASLREVEIEPVPLEGFAVWVAKLKPLLLQ